MTQRVSRLSGLPSADRRAVLASRQPGAGLDARVPRNLHYGVWLVALPLVGLGAAPWRWRDIPLIRHRDGWPPLIRTILLGGAGGVALLWVCRAIDYPTVRDAYFTVAILHMLAEAPFLLGCYGGGSAF
jgi:hypothetical protein